MREDLLARFDKLIETGRKNAHSFSKSEYGGERSLMPEQELHAFAASALAAIEEATGTNSAYSRHLPKPPYNGSLQYCPEVIKPTLGVLVAVRDAISNGYLQTIEQRVRDNVEFDFIEQAATLLEAGYHIAAMVLIGGVLEDRLRAMCASRTLEIQGNGSIARYNDALYKADVYAKSALHRIREIGDLRNSAAHGGEDAAKVRPIDVEDALKYVKRFVAEHV